MDDHDQVRRIPFEVLKGGEQPAGQRFKLEMFADIEPVLDEEWLIDGLLPAYGLAAVYGPPSCGKSFLTADAMMSVAAGRRWCGADVEQGAVIYIAAEGGPGFRKRIAAARMSHEYPRETPFALITDCPNLGAAEGDVPLLLQRIREQQSLLPIPVKAIVIDTLARTMVGADENGSADMGIFISNADTLAREMKCLVVVVHHTGKDVARGMRGSSALHGAADAEWAIDTDDDGRSVKIAKMKDGEDGLSWRFDLEQIKVGTSTKGKPVTSCAVRTLNEPHHAKSAGKSTPRKLSPQNKRAKDILIIALTENAVPLPKSLKLPEGMKGITMDQWREACQRHNLSDTQNPDNVRRAAARALNNLAGNGIAGTVGEWVWLVAQD